MSTACFALCPASLGAYLWLFYHYFSTRPSNPQPELGLVYALNNHGAYVYISAVESTGLAFLMWAFLAGFAAAVGIVPKKYIVPPPSTPRWLTYLPSFEAESAKEPTRNDYILLVVSVAFFLAVIILAGPSMAEFAVAHGIILSY